LFSPYNPKLVQKLVKDFGEWVGLGHATQEDQNLIHLQRDFSPVLGKDFWVF
jgi:hypothetical protein